MPKSSKFFRDPIHGYIEVDGDFIEIVDSSLFQRLRRIRQLAFTDLVYHGAEHSRFGHSLGAYHLASGIANKFGIKDSQIKNEFRLAALLHDIGHPPCSHAFEAVVEDLHMNGKHEAYTEAIIRHTEIGDKIVDLGLSKDTIAKLIRGRYIEKPESSYLNELISSELDVDRLDYLLRDSYYCGVPYGKYDLQRLLLGITTKNGKVVVEEKARHATENFILSRFWMYTQVYTHHTRRAFDVMLKFIYSKDILKDLEYPRPTKKEIGNIENYDDAWLFEKTAEIAQLGKGNESIIAQCFRRGKQIRRAVDKIAYAQRDSQRIDPQFTAIETLESFKDEIAANIGIDPDLIFFDKPWKDLPFESKYRQYGQGEGGAIELLFRDGETRDIAFDPSSLAFNVSKWIARVVRVYTLELKRKTLAKVIAKKCPDLKPFLITG